MNKRIVIPLLALFLLLIDLYAFEAVKAATQGFSAEGQQIAYWIYWGISALVIGGVFLYHFGPPYIFGKHGRTFVMVAVFTHYFAKVFILLFLFIEDIWRMLKWAWNSLTGGDDLSLERSEALAQTSLAVATVPVAAISFGILTGAHDYRVRKREVHLPSLPRALDGLRVVQISDVHSGSFWNKKAVQGGIEMLNQQKGDVVFFTGDLVNNRASEMKEYAEVFSKIKAPLGVYSILGNHDYGDYVDWASPHAKQQNLQKLATIHREMGWDLLLNESRILKIENEPLAVLGIENWSAKMRFPKYGRLADAYAQSRDIPTKILLSHDPSHWDAEVRKDFSDIDLTLSGHTHGMQFGIDIPGFKWSPVKYVYNRWADLYQEADQYLYVNRGFGYLGFPGRVGMPPEITVLELRS